MFPIILVPATMALAFVYAFSKQGMALFSAWRNGVIAGDSLLKTPVERVTDPAQFSVLLRNGVMSLVARVLVAFCIFFVIWSTIRPILKH
jgi:hypothetical protein